MTRTRPGSAVRDRRTWTRAIACAVVSISLAGCCLFGEDAVVAIRAATAPIPDRGRRLEPPVDLDAGLRAEDRARVVDWMARRTLGPRADAGEVEQSAAAVRREWAALFDDLAGGPIERAALDASGRIGRHFAAPNPKGVALEGHDARYGSLLEWESILVVARPNFAFAFYRVPPPCAEGGGPSAADRYRWLVVFDGDVVFSVE